MVADGERNFGLLEQRVLLHRGRHIASAEGKVFDRDG
jgi:hypothetical protein